MEPTRPYRMRARAEAAAETGDRILAAAEAAFWERPVDEIPLTELARRAGVSVQTVIRRYGSKEDVFAAAVRRGSERIRRHRDRAAPGDLPGAVRNLIEHYEEVGDGVLRMLAQEDRLPALRQIADSGRRQHRAWCQRVFAAALDGRRGVDRARRLALLVATTDVYTWKLLRRDQRLSGRQTELALRELIEPLLGGS